jgi:enoyl-CoA hydratase
MLVVAGFVRTTGERNQQQHKTESTIMTESTVLLSIDGQIATITLNRPEKLNAIEPTMLARLDEIAGEIERRDDLQVVLLTGAGERAFSVGADINAWSALQPLDMWRRWVREGHRVFARLAHMRQPLIAAVNGYAFGGGLELALAADIRLAATEAEFALPEVKIATIPGWTGTQRLPALIGLGRAKQLIFSGARIDAATAERWGLVNELAPRAELLARARSLADLIAANAPISVQIAKQVIDGTGDAAGVALEALAGALAATTDDAREGLASFRERRTARFIGS